MLKYWASLFFLNLHFVCAEGAKPLDPPSVRGFVSSDLAAPVFGPNKIVRVRVRAIRATQPLQEGEIHSSSLVTNESHVYTLDPQLKDLRAKFEKLAFHSYKLLTLQSIDIPLKKKQTLGLVHGQTLTLRPLYIDGQRIGLWLNWRDPTGADILDTRLHFDSDQSMITGAESSDDSALILAIDVQGK